MVIKKTTTVEEIMIAWLNEIERPNLKPASFDRKENTCKFQVFPYIGNTPAKLLCNNDIENLIQQLLQKGYANSTIKKAVEAVGCCYRYYRLHGKLSNDPVLGVRVPSGGRSKYRHVRFFLPEQVAAIQKECLRTYGNGTRVYPQGDLIIILLNTGMRVGELLALTWRDVDLHGRMINIDKNSVRVKQRKPDGSYEFVQIVQDSTKTSSGIRYVPINQTAHDAFLRLAELTGRRGFIARSRTGQPLLIGNIERTLLRILRNCGYPREYWYNVHALRHTFASNLLRKGADIKKVSEILGHSTVKFTYDYYIHFMPKDYTDTVNLLDEL